MLSFPNCSLLQYYLLNIAMLVIGNGESRKHIDISKYDKIKVGCNAIFRDFYVNHWSVVTALWLLKHNKHATMGQYTLDLIGVMNSNPVVLFLNCHIKAMTGLDQTIRGIGVVVLNVHY